MAVSPIPVDILQGDSKVHTCCHMIVSPIPVDILQGDSKVHTCCHMAVSPIPVDVLPHYCTNLKPLHCQFQLRPQHFAHSSAT